MKTHVLSPLLFAVTTLCAAPAFAQRPPEPARAQPAGFLCCNMRSNGNWISDINYTDAGQQVVPLGTPIQVTGYGRQRVQVTIDGKRQAIGNDYSRDLDLETFAKRYVVGDDPARKLAAYPPKQRESIKAGRVSRGMSREQVLMALGYPVSSENPRLDAPIWRYWVSTFAEFQVQFDDAGLVKDVDAEPRLKRTVWDD